jgi:hypothetical protein
MLQSAYTNPERLRDMKRTFALMSERDRDTLPKGLITLIETFTKAVK